MAVHRRTVLRGLAALGGSAGLLAVAAACAPSAAPPAAPASTESRPTRTFKVAYLTLGWAGFEIVQLPAQESAVDQRRRLPDLRHRGRRLRSARNS